MSESKQSYSRILKSSSLIGGAQGINILIGLVRVKFVAVLIGPLGVGLAGTYQALIGFFGTFAGLGLQGSAVRDIAEAVGSQDNERIGRTILTLRRMCWLSGLSGTALVVALSGPLSRLTFGSPEHQLEVALVGSTILLTNIKGGQMALIQGMRRIADIAKLNVIGVAVGSVISVGLYYWLGVGGVVPAIILLGVTQLLASWWFASKIVVPTVSMTWGESFRAAGGMVRLGIALMFSALLVSGVAYATRTLIASEMSLVAVGIYGAAFNLSGMMVNFVLQAMGADYYPSLTAVNQDHAKMRDLVNQQAEIGLLLALPAILAVIIFAPWMIKLFYTSEFTDAVVLLQIFSLGCLGRVLSWPMGFIILALGRAKLFAFTQLLSNGTHLVLICFGLHAFGLIGVALAFALLYLLYTAYMLCVSMRLIRFSWSPALVRLLAFVLPVVGLVFALARGLPLLASTVVGGFVVSVVSLLCLRGLLQRLGAEHKICRLFQRFHFFQ
ncbi:O-antigen translocase [Algibacter sp.]|nr:O-antigen translocase [Algibacter sp.]